VSMGRMPQPIGTAAVLMSRHWWSTRAAGASENVSVWSKGMVQHESLAAVTGQVESQLRLWVDRW
jgi:hypothetical protein